MKKVKFKEFKDSLNKNSWKHFKECDLYYHWTEN